MILQVVVDPREQQPFEDVSPIKHGVFPASHVSFLGVYPN